ncbi:MAG TPA: DUF4142 domain-containing protein [Pseudolabrys sp.]|nr:DUF4142 domain-containing protein [Pseudolabrys sp.]
MKRTGVILAGIMAGCLAASAAAAQTSQNKASQNRSSEMGQPTRAQQDKADKATRRFIKDAVQGDLTEVNMGKLAQEKGQSEAVKEYGAMLVQDHGSHLSKVQEMASELGVSAPKSLNAEQKADYAKLKALSGASFDRAFARAMVSDHKKDIKEYQKEASKNDAAGQLAKQTLPVLQKHLEHAQQLTSQTSQKQSSR